MFSGNLKTSKFGELLIETVSKLGQIVKSSSLILQVSPDGGVRLKLVRLVKYSIPLRLLRTLNPLVTFLDNIPGPASGITVPAAKFSFVPNSSSVSAPFFSVSTNSLKPKRKASSGKILEITGMPSTTLA